MENKYKGYKKVVFYQLTDTHARVLIKLKYDDLKQQEFFSSLMDAYLEEDENIMDFIHEFKMKKSRMKKKARLAKRERQKQREIAEQFNLSKEEIEDLFSIIEQEHDL